MKTPLVPSLMLLALAAALCLLPDGAFRTWRLRLHGSLARLSRPDDGIAGPEAVARPVEEELIERLRQKDEEIAVLNRRLRELGQTREAFPALSIVPARIIALGPNSTLDSFTIDAGTSQGVKPGDAVVVGQALAGVVAQSEPGASLALSLSSPGCYLSARIGPRESSGIAARELGAAQGSGLGEIRAVVFSSGSDATTGWLATTSGLEDGIPEGILIGTVAGEFYEGRENGAVEAQLTPFVNLNGLDYVTVIGRQ
ncbi:MAG: rod shape-determining protein MreC [Planctomycetota bacterium]|jgi:rod shape-determining protein MreC|nr:rod shape-determining protein MreC [Planctomycetota bacterium]